MSEKTRDNFAEDDAANVRRLRKNAGMTSDRVALDKTVREYRKQKEREREFDVYYSSKTMEEMLNILEDKWSRIESRVVDGRKDIAHIIKNDFQVAFIILGDQIKKQRKGNTEIMTVGDLRKNDEEGRRKKKQSCSTTEKIKR